jgi:hypothetical protein
MKCRDGYACPAHVLADGDPKVACGLLDFHEVAALRVLAGSALSAHHAGYQKLGRALVAVLRQLEDAERRAAGYEELTRAAEGVALSHERAERRWTSITTLEEVLARQADDRAGRCSGAGLMQPVVAGRNACSRCEATFDAPADTAKALIPTHPPQRIMMEAR